MLIIIQQFEIKIIFKNMNTKINTLWFWFNTKQKRIQRKGKSYLVNEEFYFKWTKKKKLIIKAFKIFIWSIIGFSLICIIRFPIIFNGEKVNFLNNKKVEEDEEDDVKNTWQPR